MKNSHAAHRVEAVKGDFTLSVTGHMLNCIDAVYIVCTGPLEAFSAPRWSGWGNTSNGLSSSPSAQDATPSSKSKPQQDETGTEQSMIKASGIDWTLPARRECWPATPGIGGHDRSVTAVSCAGRTSVSQQLRSTNATSRLSAMRTLCDDGHAGTEYVLTGPQSLSQFQQLSTIGDVIGCKLTIKIPRDEAQSESVRDHAETHCQNANQCLVSRDGPARLRYIDRRGDHRHAGTNVPRWATDHASDFQLREDV